MAVAGCGERLSLKTQHFISAGPGISINGHIQDPGIKLDAWAAASWEYFTPSAAADGFSLVNGVDASRFLYDGKNLDIVYTFLFSTLSTFNGNEFKLPLPGGVPAPQMGTIGMFADDVIMGMWDLYDNSSGLYYAGSCYPAAQPTTQPFRFRTSGFSQGGTSAQTVRQGTPITLGFGDVFSAWIRVETT
jgi:hypothetical protein